MAAARLGSDPLSRAYPRVDVRPGHQAIPGGVERHGAISLLRVSLAVVYLWFGLLKLAGVSPAHDLVVETLHWFHPTAVVLFLGLWEAGIGLALLFRPTARIGLWLMLAHLPGTALPLLVRPDLCFTHWPVGLTMDGEFIIKNLVLASAALVVCRARQRPHAIIARAQ